MRKHYKRMYPTGPGSPRFYGLPKIHKAGTLLRSIVSSRGTFTYGTAKELARILKPLMGMSPHHVLSTRDFVQHLRASSFSRMNVSYDVKALFTSVPIVPSINIIKNKLHEVQGFPTKNIHGHPPNHQPVGVLPEEDIFCIPRQIF